MLYLERYEEIFDIKNEVGDKNASYPIWIIKAIYLLYVFIVVMFIVILLTDAVMKLFFFLLIN